MMNLQVEETVLRSILREATQKDVSQLGWDDDLRKDLQLDSLGELMVLVAVEKHFDVEIPANQLSELGTLRKLLNVLNELSKMEGVKS